MLRRLVTVTAMLAGLMSLPAQALEFRSVKETGVALYEAPALSAKKLFVVSRYYPVEVLSSQKEWSRVRDATGVSPGFRWRHFPAALAAGDCRSGRGARCTGCDGKPLFSVARDGVLQWQEAPKDGWVRIKHRDGSAAMPASATCGVCKP
jgi:hypothetical protein